MFIDTLMDFLMKNYLQVYESINLALLNCLKKHLPLTQYCCIYWRRVYCNVRQQSHALVTRTARTWKPEGDSSNLGAASQASSHTMRRSHFVAGRFEDQIIWSLCSILHLLYIFIIAALFVFVRKINFTSLYII